MPTIGRYLYHESGLEAVYSAGSNAWLIILSRSTRMFAYGAISLILALFFDELHVSESRIGLFMTLTLAGDLLLSLLLTLVADRVGRRRTLFFGSVLMTLSGIIFSVFENYWILLLAAIIGVISATGGDIGPFRAIEESTLSELTTPTTRADVLAWYVTTASLGSAFGTMACGRFVDWMRARDGWQLIDAYHACFWIYIVMGVLGMISSLLLTEKCELGGKVSTDQPTEADEPFLDGSSSDTAVEEIQEEPKTKQGRFAQISRETRSIMYALWLLLMLDSFADGMVGLSLTTYYMDQKFHPSKSTLGAILSAAHFLSSCSSIFAGPLSRHIGLISTMVFTHVPSSTAVLLFPLPQSMALTFTLLLIRIGLNNMDQAPRTALIAAVVKSEERTAVMGITSMLRTLASLVGPTVTGFLANNDKFWIAFVAAGSLRLAYDLGLFVMFINFKVNKHESVETENNGYSLVEQRRPDDEEQVAKEQRDQTDE